MNSELFKQALPRSLFDTVVDVMNSDGKSLSLLQIASIAKELLLAV